MQRKMIIASVALLALAALEFGLLGAQAAGFGIGAGGQPHGPQLAKATPTPRLSPPPCVEPASRRQLSPPCSRRPAPPACPLSPPAVSPPCVPPGPPAATIELGTFPDEIRCDGVDASKVRVHLRTAEGRNVADGTPVFFSVYWPGRAEPGIAFTNDGVTVSLVTYGPFQFGAPSQFSVNVSSARIEASIRIFCAPQPPACAPSPPLSGPGSVSPPCATPTPPCPMSPPPLSGPGAISPPCPPTATPTPPCPLSAPTQPSCLPAGHSRRRRRLRAVRSPSGRPA